MIPSVNTLQFLSVDIITMVYLHTHLPVTWMDKLNSGHVITTVHGYY